MGIRSQIIQLRIAADYDEMPMVGPCRCLDVSTFDASLTRCQPRAGAGIVVRVRLILEAADRFENLQEAHVAVRLLGIRVQPYDALLLCAQTEHSTGGSPTAGAGYDRAAT